MNDYESSSFIEVFFGYAPTKYEIFLAVKTS